jgi:repressor LexA
MAREPLTKRQREVFDFIVAEIRDRGIPPTVREIGKHFGITSPNGVIFHLKVFARKGYIKHLPDIARGIVVVDDPQAELLAAARHLLDDDADDYTEHFERLQAAVDAYGE